MTDEQALDLAILRDVEKGWKDLTQEAKPFPPLTTEELAEVDKWIRDDNTDTPF